MVLLVQNNGLCLKQKTVTYHDPDLRFLAYGIGKNQITNNGFSVDYTAGYISLPITLTHGPEEAVEMTFDSNFNRHIINSPMLILPLKIDCFIRRRTGNYTLNSSGQSPGLGTYPSGLAGLAVPVGTDWHQVNQVSVIAGNKNWNADDHSIPTHIVGNLTQGGDGRIKYEILIDADEQNDTINPWGGVT